MIKKEFDLSNYTVPYYFFVGMISKGFTGLIRFKIQIIQNTS
jgi:hypothetical protein